MTHCRVGLLLACVAWPLALAGCGYRAGGLYRSDAETVYVEMFASKEFRRDLEFLLTEAVKKRIAMQTPYRLAPKEKADTILTGDIPEQRVASFAPAPLSRQPRERVVTVAARVLWKDQRSGRVLVDEPVILQSADYLDPALTGESERLAQERAIDRLAERIVAKMYDGW